MLIQSAVAAAAIIAALSAAHAQGYRVEDVDSPQDLALPRLKNGVIAFSDKQAGTAGEDAGKLISFGDWSHAQPLQQKFLSLFPGYTEPTVTKIKGAEGSPVRVTEKLSMYVAQARFILDKSPGAIELSHYVTLDFLKKIDPAITHRQIAAADLVGRQDRQGTGNDNPERKWCAARAKLVCIESTYKLEGKIPVGIMLVNKLRDTAKKVVDHIDFDSELSAIDRAAIDQAGLKELTGLDSPVSGVLEQNIFYVNQILKFAKFFGVFQADPADAGKTVVTAYMVLAVESSVLDKQKEFEKVPVLRNLVPAQVLMGESSFNSGSSISAGLPIYARNEIKTIAGLLAADK